MNKNTDTFLLGTWCKFQNAITKKSFDYITKTNHIDIIKEMHYKCSFIHPSVMFKKEVIDVIGLYPTTFPHCEDYAFFWEIIKQRKVAIFPETLMTINTFENSISSKNYKTQIKSRIKVVKFYGINWG